MNKKLMSLLLVLVLALPMVFVAANAMAAEETKLVKVTTYFVRSTGGPVNVWPQPKKIPQTSLGMLKNKTPLTVLETGTYFWKVSGGGKTGWMDKKYVGSVTVEKDPNAKPEEPVVIKDAKIRGTARNSIINIWPTMSNKYNKDAKPVRIPVGTLLTNVEQYKKAGWTKVTFEVAQDVFVTGYVQNKWILNMTVK